MMQEIGLELLKGIGKLFLNPLVYITVVFAVLLGYVRVKRERRSFRTRILWGWTEVKRLVADTWLFALILSVISIATGLTVTMDWILAFSVASILLVVLYVYQIGSPIFAAALAILAMGLGYSFSFIGFDWNPADNWMVVAVSVGVLIGAVVFVEGWMIRKEGAHSASPILEKSSRGMNAAVYLSKRLWLLPILVLVPGDVISTYAPYWPQITIGQDAFGLVLLPVVIGFAQKARRTLPVYFYPVVGKAVMVVGVSVVVIALIGIWMPIFGVISLAVGVVSRLGVWLYFSMKERQGSYAVSPHNLGVMIAGVLPDSPADKMGLVVGECIRKVNGLSVTNERDLYEAIQINAAHCRLEVLDHQGEVRLRQHVIYRHDHHRLGLLVVR
ncbi:PDZ domain-containing protein [Paenisporosarcina quisquiliarum]|uniref:PDZ domain-containing protein n=1 Tax=Paenisporosarcina quisquiliarum TaxID=365346 RepID=UPI0037368A1E